MMHNSASDVGSTTGQKQSASGSLAPVKVASQYFLTECPPNFPTVKLSVAFSLITSIVHKKAALAFEWLGGKDEALNRT